MSTPFISVEKLRSFFFIFLPAYTIFYFAFLVWAHGEYDGVRSLINLTGTTTAMVVMWLARGHWGAGGFQFQRIWMYFFLGIVFVLLGDIVWFGMEKILNMEVGIPSPADVFFSMGYLFWMYALFRYVLSKKNRDIRSISFDAAITLVLMLAVVLRFGNMPVPDEEEMGALARFINIFYPMADTFYLLGLLVLFFISDRIRLFWKEALCISIAFILFFVADQSFLFIANTYSMLEYLFDPFWPLGRLFIAAASLYIIVPAKENLENTHAVSEKLDAWSFFQMSTPYFLAIGIIFLIGPEYILKDPLFFGVNVVIALIIVRQISALIENKKLLESMRSANAELMKNRSILLAQNERLIHASDQKEIEASTDFLTELKNRRHINEVLDGMSHTSAAHVTLGLMLIDVDHFKPINDTWGHQVGDEVLRLVANAIASVARSSDIAGRFGGDEFVLVLPGADVPTLHKVAQRLLDAIAQAPLPHAGIKLGLSIGAAAWVSARADYDKEALLLKADKALYAVKEAGRNGYRVAED